MELGKIPFEQVPMDKITHGIGENVLRNLSDGQNHSEQQKKCPSVLLRWTKTLITTEKMFFGKSSLKEQKNTT